VPCHNQINKQLNGHILRKSKAAIIIIIKQLRNRHKEYDDDKNDTVANDNNKSITPFSFPIANPVQ